MMSDEPPPPARRPPSASALARKSAPAQPWSHVETMHLIDAYEERWTALRRGQLKAHQWEEVAAEVVARCAATPGVAAPPRKTGTQCRHKLEKLRKRYRTEGARPVASLWPYFRRMDRLERGPLAADSSSPYPDPPAADGDEEEEEDEEEDEEDEAQEGEEEEEELVPRSNHTRSINGIIREFGTGLAPRHPQLQQLHHPQAPPPSSITPSTAPPRKRVAYEAFQAKAAAAAAAATAGVKAKDDEGEAVELAHRGGGSAGGGAGAQLSAVLRDFGEGVMRLERRRMEMQWEIERGWQEVDARHARMLQDAQRQLRDTVAAACALPPKKARRDHGDS